MNQKETYELPENPVRVDLDTMTAIMRLEISVEEAIADVQRHYDWGNSGMADLKAGKPHPIGKMNLEQMNALDAEGHRLIAIMNAAFALDSARTELIRAAFRADPSVKTNGEAVAWLERNMPSHLNEVLEDWILTYGPEEL